MAISVLADFANGVVDLANNAGQALGLTDRPQRPSPFDASPLGQSRRAFMDTIASYESPSYNTMYGGSQFSSYADHPRVGHRITSGPNKGRNSTAAGRYQFKASTWDRLQRELDLPDFSPESQDIAAYQLAKEDYAAATGQNLDDVLATGDPNQIAAAASQLHGTWTSLPGGIESQTGVRGFARNFARNLTAIVQPDQIAADVPTPTPRPDIPSDIQRAQLAPPAGSVAPSPAQTASVAPLTGQGASQQLLGGDTTPSIAPDARVAAAPTAYAEQVQAERAPALQAIEHLVGKDVTPPSSSFLGRPSMPGSNTVQPSSSFLGRPAGSQVAARDTFETPRSTVTERGPAISATSSPDNMSAAQFAGFVGLQPDHVGRVAPTEKVSPLDNYAVQSPQRTTDVLSPAPTVAEKISAVRPDAVSVKPSVTTEALKPTLDTETLYDRPAPIDPNYTPPAAVQPAPPTAPATGLPKIGTPEEPTPEELAKAPPLAPPVTVPTRKVAAVAPAPRRVATPPVTNLTQQEQPKKPGFLGSIFDALKPDVPNPPSYDFGSGASSIDSILGGGGLAGAVARSNSNPNVTYKDLGNGVVAKINTDPRFAKPTVEYSHYTGGASTGKGFFAGLSSLFGGGGSSSSGKSKSGGGGFLGGGGVNSQRGGWHTI